MFVANIVSISRRDALTALVCKNGRGAKSLMDRSPAPSRMYNRTSRRRRRRGVANYFIAKDKKSGRERLIGALARATRSSRRETCVYSSSKTVARAGTLVPSRGVFAIQMSGGTCRWKSLSV